jgi:D-arabinose 1-dehydrogenase-like Zn-dependent alcohol dehydrogenase
LFLTTGGAPYEVRWVCHSDLHFAHNEWSSLVQTAYPWVPGPEIVGRVAKVGSGVTQSTLGDLAAVGCPSLSGSPIGGIAETQQMLDFCVQHCTTADVEVIPIQTFNEAYHQMAKGDVEYRFSIDMASLRSA